RGPPAVNTVRRDGLRESHSPDSADGLPLQLRTLRLRTLVYRKRCVMAQGAIFPRPKGRPGPGSLKVSVTLYRASLSPPSWVSCARAVAPACARRGPAGVVRRRAPVGRAPGGTGARCCMVPLTPYYWWGVTAQPLRQEGAPARAAGE